jgi:hypothetical protein
VLQRGKYKIEKAKDFSAPLRISGNNGSEIKAYRTVIFRVIITLMVLPTEGFVSLVK